MKNFFLLIFLVPATLFSNAQVPNSIPYQAVVRNPDGSVMAEAAITMTFKIHDNSAIGNVVYEETHAATTNSQGLISLNLGNGAAVSGTFSGINWGSGSKFLHVLMNGGNGAIDLGTQQMMSVPYALYAAKAGETSSTSNLQIGQTHAGGKIFYLDQSGQHGLVYAEMTSYPLYTRESTHSIFGDCIGSGKLNNKAYLSSRSPSSTSANDAIIYCDSLNLNGFSDWFLPSSYELYELVNNNNAILPLGFYLSSTDGIKSISPGSTYSDGWTLVRPMLVENTTIGVPPLYKEIRFSLGYCFSLYVNQCSVEYYYVVPVRQF